MKLLLFLATVAAIALFYWISSTSIDIPAKWSLALKIEYRWYIFQDKLGLPMNTADRRHFQLMID